MAFLVLLALSAFLGAVLLHASSFAAVVPTHLALASGAMPLIAGAMLHFVPVLTRSVPSAPGLRTVPLLLLVAGLLVFASFVLPEGAAGLRDLAAVLGVIAVATLGWWIAKRSRKSIGRPHPGVHWYLAALACLLLGLIAVLLMRLWPEHYLALRRFHLHVNTLGFLGMTAIGTLQVLLPTALGRADSRAGERLRNDLKWAVAGTLLIAAGAAWQNLLVWPGLLSWSVPLARLAAAWWTLFRQEPARWSGIATSLAGALLGFSAALAFGGAHALGWLNPANASVAFVLLFLLPLVTGAAGYLLPLWLRPTAPSDWHTQTRRELGRFGALRTLLFIGAGTVTISWGLPWGAIPAAAGLGLFGMQLRALVKPGS